MLVIQQKLYFLFEWLKEKNLPEIKKTTTRNERTNKKQP